MSLSTLRIEVLALPPCECRVGHISIGSKVGRKVIEPEFVWVRLPSDRKVNTVSLHGCFVAHAPAHVHAHTLLNRSFGVNFVAKPSFLLSCVGTKFESTGQGSALS